MRCWFPALVARNAGDMKWKKFLYRQLCEREQLLICKSPSCSVCSDLPVCFGPET
jgi:nitrogen fixation protein NifQ